LRTLRACCLWRVRAQARVASGAFEKINLRHANSGMSIDISYTI
jgi:hypothetical protein